MMPVKASTATVTFNHLKPGIYAVTVYHDENNNGQFDMSVFGAEGFAASNGVVGPPTFAGAAVKVTGDRKLTLTMIYY
jgi:uncharacterized protein (DUF2141 family)